MRRYNPKEIEPKWQKIWEESQVFHVTENSDKPKKYVIDMFPYPSGAAMHVGHMRNYTISDVISQYLRQKGYNVMHTMGWDTFGLPAENYAIKTGVSPQESTKANIANFKSQLKRLGMSYDWSREINTTDPKYYKWTQWIFTQLFEHGLAYQKESLQWWCPVDKTVLANEQVEAGRCWRCGNEVEKKSMKQWFFKITAYAEELLKGIDDLEWPEKIKAMQRNWIGKSIGASIFFEVAGSEDKIEVFTTRPDTVFGATFMVLAPEHELVQKITTDEQKSAVETYIRETQKKSEVDRMSETRHKTGVFTGAYVINPFTGKEIPVWIADYVLPGYGTGAIMAVPAHDERDYEFAKKFDLPIVRVVQNDAPDEACTPDEGIMINSGEFNGLPSQEARNKIVEALENRGIGKETVNYKMRDWLISRQRYWGAPIPIIHCPVDGPVAVPKEDLPVELPEVESYLPGDDGRSVLERVESWVNTTCPKCGGPAKRETDTMDGYACSSWYFLRYTDPNNNEQAWSPEKANYWLPIDYYCGGDHAVSHLLYSRFWMHFFADQGWIEKTRKEPVKRLVYNGYILAADGTKMSKSKGNVVNPDELIEQGYGADALRLFEMFIAPYDQSTNWNTNGVPGTYRFLQRVWTLTQEFLEAEKDLKATSGTIMRTAHSMIKKVSDDLEHLSFNTAVAALMEGVNELYKVKAAEGFTAGGSWHFALSSLTQLLAPFAPHIAEELWEQLGHKGSVHVNNWPVYDESYLVADTMNIVVQVNGKVRANITVSADADQDTVKAAAKANPKVQEYLQQKEVRKTIYVPQKLINFVI